MHRWTVLALALTSAAAGAQRETERASAADVREHEAHARALKHVARADALLRAGRVAAAESLYYAVSRWRPRDPAPRLALGRYLAARGATRIGAVLIEEARQFGANPAVAALYLAPLYARLGAWEALRDLPAASLTAGERERAAWLAGRTSAVEGPDSIEVPLRRARSAGALGAVVLRIGEDSVVAEIDPEAHGIVVDRARRGVRRFAGGSADARQEAGVVDRASLGGFTLTNVPVAFGATGDPGAARIGLDVLAPWAPSARGGRLVLRRDGVVSSRGRGERLPLLLDPAEGARVARSGRLEPPAAVVRDAPWTIDPRAGELIVHR
jgi:hypothetical protein